MKKTLLTALYTATGLLAAQSVSAQSDPDATDYFKPPGNTGLPQTPVVELILNIISTVLGAMGIIAVILVMYGGFTILTSAGNQERVDTGRKVLIWAAIGTIIIFSSLGIVLFFNNAITPGS